MTKKHFISLADMIRKNPLEFSDRILILLARWCAEQNPRFNTETWFSYIKSK